jgi:hypothetical protein
MHDIFLSYASEDRARASQLPEALGKQGWEVWWDRTILPGKTFDRVIESELNAATCVIVLWSKTSVESRWVRAEAGDALDKGRLIPVLLEDLKIPLVFRQIQAASLLDWGGDTEHAGFIQLTRAITTFVSPTLTSDTSTDVGDTTSKPETAAPEPAPRQLGALRESSHTAGAIEVREPVQRPVLANRHHQRPAHRRPVSLFILAKTDRNRNACDCRNPNGPGNPGRTK